MGKRLSIDSRTQGAPADNHSAPIGWIGAGGRMGSEMVMRLLASGRRVAAYNRTPAKLARLLEQGAVAVDSPADLASCPLVFVTVGGDADFEQVILGDRGVAASGAQAPEVIVDATTVSAEISASVRSRLAERDVGFLAAAVSGNAKVIRAGLLSLVVSGDRDAFDRARADLEVLARRVTYAGAGEQARLVKLCHNLYLGMVIEALVEICVLASELGLARADVLEFINGGVMGSSFSRYKSPALVNLDFEPTFTLELLQKDLSLGIALGESVGVELPFSNAVRESVARTIADGFAGQDFAALIATRAKASGVEIVPENVALPTGLEPAAAAATQKASLDRG